MKANKVGLRPQISCYSLDGIYFVPRLQPGLSAVVHTLDKFEFDVGPTYLEDQCLAGFHVQALYRERHKLLARDQSMIADKAEISWKEVPDVPVDIAYVKSKRQTGWRRRTLIQ